MKEIDALNTASDRFLDTIAYQLVTGRNVQWVGNEAYIRFDDIDSKDVCPRYTKDLNAVAELEKLLDEKGFINVWYEWLKLASETYKHFARATAKERTIAVIMATQGMPEKPMVSL